MVLSPKTRPSASFDKAQSTILETLEGVKSTGTPQVRSKVFTVSTAPYAVTPLKQSDDRKGDEDVTREEASNSGGADCDVDIASPASYTSLTVMPQVFDLIDLSEDLPKEEDSFAEMTPEIETREDPFKVSRD